MSTMNDLDEVIQDLKTTSGRVALLISVECRQAGAKLSEFKLNFPEVKQAQINLAEDLRKLLSSE